MKPSERIKEITGGMGHPFYRTEVILQYLDEIYDQAANDAMEESYTPKEVVWTEDHVREIDLSMRQSSFDFLDNQIEEVVRIIRSKIKPE